MGQQQNDQFGMMMQGGGQMNNMSMNANSSNTLGGSSQSGRGSMNERQMLMQQQMMQGQQGMVGQSNNMQQGPHADLMGRRSQDLSGSMNASGQRNNTNNNAFDMDGSMGSQRSNRIPQAVGGGGIDGPGDNNGGGGGGGAEDPSNKSFLDGSFAGGWQSNADLPDRRRIIFSILEVIRQMRPDTNKISQK
jgi:hypothetical protein